ncbi:hypothetical protein BRC68_03785, partial [Halobacteriales archaeon QH_6_64_20]
DSRQERENDPPTPDEDDIERVVNELDVRTLERIDPRKMATASVAGSVQTLLDWRYSNDDLDGLVKG